MTREEAERQRREQAQLSEFETNFQKFLQGRAEYDAGQVIGREHTPRFDQGGDLDRQRNEQAGRIERAFDADTLDLERQNKTERAEFGSWMQEQRDRMRAEDAAERPGRATPRLAPALTYGPAGRQDGPARGIDKDFARREEVRDQAGATMHRRFEQYQKQQHAERLDALFARRDDNLEQLGEAHQRAAQRQTAEREKLSSAGDDGATAEQKEPPKREYTRMPDETDKEFAARVERAAKRTAEAPKLELKPDELEIGR